MSIKIDENNLEKYEVYEIEIDKDMTYIVVGSYVYTTGDGAEVWDEDEGDYVWNEDLCWRLINERAWVPFPEYKKIREKGGTLYDCESYDHRCNDEYADNITRDEALETVKKWIDTLDYLDGKDITEDVEPGMYIGVL